jgi:hypothetical protein
VLPSDADKKILKRIRERRDAVVSATQDDRELALEDTLFCKKGNQWPEDAKAKRIAAGRPVMEVDHTNAFVDQLVNDERQNRPSVKVSPIGDGADEDLAEVLQGYFRHVEMISNADYAYDRASEAQKRGGFGFMRVTTRYTAEDSFDQDLIVDSCANAFQWHLDPNSIQPDGSDAKWALGEVDISRDDFEDMFPDAQGLSWLESVGNEAKGWLSADRKTIRIAEYYELQEKPISLVKLRSGETIKLPSGQKVDKALLDITAERKSTETELWWYKTNGVEILESRKLAGKLIPIIPVYGKELIVNGERWHWGVVRALKDPAIAINAYTSNITEALGLAPKVPWIAAIGSIPENLKHDWASAGSDNKNVLYYNAWSPDNAEQQLPSPTRNVVEPAIQAMVIAKQDAEMALKSVSNMFNPSRGNQEEGNMSGRAIRALQQQGQTGNFHYSDNLARSIRHLWRVVLGMIPEVIDTERMLRIVGVDGTEKRVKVNTSEPVEGLKSGVAQIYDMKRVKEGYDIHISTGPSYASKRQESTAVLMDLAKVSPAIMDRGGDIVVRQIDFAANDELADRLTPQEFKKPDENQPQIPPQVQQQLQQMGQMIEMQTQALDKFNDERDTEIVKLNAQKEIELIRQRTELVKLYVTQQGKYAEVLLKAEMGRIEQELALTPDIPSEDGETPEAPATPQPAGSMAGGQPATVATSQLPRLAEEAGSEEIQ